MELTEYTSLHEADLMLTLLKVACARPATIDDIVDRLKQNLHSINEDPPVDDGDLRDHIERARLHLAKALLLECVSGNRFRITARGVHMLDEHPTGFDSNVLAKFPEFRAFLEKQSARHLLNGGANLEQGHESELDDPCTKEFSEGYAAFQSNLGMDANPYEVDRVVHQAWQNGWSQARDDTLRDERRPQI
jgi:hypothetical protein